MIKFCKDCKYFHEDVLGEYNCYRSVSISQNLVTSGKRTIGVRDCFEERYTPYFDGCSNRYCGELGQFWREKDAKVL